MLEHGLVEFEGCRARELGVVEVHQILNGFFDRDWVIGTVGMFVEFITEGIADNLP
jgi:hypothetical protein